MDEKQKTTMHSRTSVVGLFMVISFVLTIPLAVLLSQERQDIRGKAAEPTQAIIAPTNIPATTTSSFSGYVYHDTNQDGQRQLEEKPFPGVTIKLTYARKNGEKSNNEKKDFTETTDIKTDSNGYFLFQPANQLPDSLSYTIQLVLPPGYKTIDTNPVIFTKEHRNTKEIIEFGLFPFTTPQLSATTPTPTKVSITPTISKQPSITVFPTIKPTTILTPSPTIKISSQGNSQGNSQGKSLHGD
jgi:hypothetical protein